MYNHFEFMEGNPYITMNNQALFKMICKYHLRFVGDECFYVEGLRKKAPKKDILRDFAIEWQLDFANRNYSYGELLEWQGFFEEYGRKYGLLREFKENCTI